MEEGLKREITSLQNRPWLSQEIDKNQSSQECGLTMVPQCR